MGILCSPTSPEADAKLVFEKNSKIDNSLQKNTQ